MEEVDRPDVGENEVLIEVKAAGVCGTDLHFNHGTFPPPPEVPVTMGHEYAGVVVETGEKVEEIKEGDNVSAHYSTSCGDCIYCNQGLDNLCLNRMDLGYNAGDGGFAEYALLPARNAFVMPEHIPMDQGAIIGCAVTTPLHAIKVRGAFKVGDRVAVYGLGGVGMHAVQWAKVLGASKVIGVDVMDYKLSMARAFGADVVVNAKEVDPAKAIYDATDGLGADLVVDCVAHENSIGQAMRSTGMAGRTVVVGFTGDKFPVDIRNELMMKESILTSSANHTRDDHRLAIDYVATGKYDLSRSITHRMPFEELNEAIAMLDEKKGDPLRIVVTR